MFVSHNIYYHTIVVGSYYGWDVLSNLFSFAKRLENFANMTNNFYVVM